MMKYLRILGALVTFGSPLAAHAQFHPQQGLDGSTPVFMNGKPIGALGPMLITLQKEISATSALTATTLREIDVGQKAPRLTDSEIASLSNITADIMAQGHAYIGTAPLDYGLTWKDKSWRPLAAFFDNFGDTPSSPRTIHMGGLQDHADAYLNLLGLLMGHSDNSGAILTVQDADSSFMANRNGAGGTDGVLEFTKTNNNPPRLKAGVDITNTDGIKRVVTFGKTSFTVTPSFTPAQLALIRGAGIIRVYANWKNGNNTAPTPHGFSRPNVYYAYMDASKATTTSDGGLKFPVMTDDDTTQPGWRTQNSINPAARAPGTNSGDSIDKLSDTSSAAPGLVWNYPDQAVFIGMSDGKTIHNDMAQYTPGNDSITRAMTGVEYDLLANQTADYQYKIDGVMINAYGNGYKLTDDSTDMYLGGYINHHLQIGDATCGVYGIEASSFISRGACTTKTDGQGYVMTQSQGLSYLGHRMVLTQANIAGKGEAKGDASKNILAIIGSVDADPSDPFRSGAGMAAIKWNAFGTDTQDISLCGGAYGAICGLRVISNGNTELTHALVLGGSGILGMDPTFKTNWVQWYPTPNGDWLMGTSVSGGGNLRGVAGYYGATATFTGTLSGADANFSAQVNANHDMVVTGNLISNVGGHLIFQNTISTAAASLQVDATGNILERSKEAIGGGLGLTVHGYRSLAHTGVAEGTQSYCSDCKSSHSTHRAVGIPVWWNGSQWTDSIGDAVIHP
ncbi:hypothetical protein GOB93_19815 [Acetobacter musti]|uniref:Uncharacterized protein n=1 Tax=Acetobacter musti TaxID=864732 RepID=A0ABX0JZA1_9PROT|nr:hypothetical protein [Acetobacter musti]NHN86829.1 hypothetical protein [Acetobacter musti]